MKKYKIGGIMDDLFEKKSRKGNVVPLYKDNGYQESDIYNPFHIFTSSSDRRGHSEKIQCRISPDMIRDVQVIIESGKFGFVTTSDFLRDSLHRGIKLFITELNDEDGLRRVRNREVSSLLEQEKYELNKIKSNIELFKELIAEAKGDKSMIDKIVKNIRAQLGLIKDGYQKKMYLKGVEGVLKSNDINPKDYFGEE